MMLGFLILKGGEQGEVGVIQTSRWVQRVNATVTAFPFSQRKLSDDLSRSFYDCEVL